MSTCYIFDFDGTLSDSANDVLSALKKALLKVEINIPSSLSVAIIGPPIKEILHRLNLNLSDNKINEVISYFREYYDHSPMLDTVPFEGVIDTLKIMKSKGHRLFVATNKPLFPTTKLIQRDFPGTFEEWICVDSQAGKSLSKTAMVSELLTNYCLDNKETTVVGDGVSDIRAARETGCVAIGVTYGYGDVGELEAAGAHILINKFTEILEVGRVK